MENIMMKDGQPVYAGFWKRFCAGLVDGLIILGVIVPISYLPQKTSMGYFSYVFLAGFSGWAYHLFFHAKFGATLGKMAVGLQIRRVDLSQIGWKEAALRSSVDIFFWVITLINTAIAVGKADPAILEIINQSFLAVVGDQEKAKAFNEAHKQMELLSPIKGVAWVQNIWFYSEMITLLFNKKRRAIHDFIAGTVVIRVPPRSPSLTGPSQG